MPTDFFNADISLPKFTTETTAERIEIIQNYLYMLLEQLRYTLSHLSTENWNEPDLDEFVEEVRAGVVTAHTVISNTIITNTLAAEKANIAEITVDQLDTSAKVKNYLSSDTSDVNYIKIYEQHIQFITASTDGLLTEQARDRNDELLYWTDTTHKTADTAVTAYPVTVYQYTEFVKCDISFKLTGENYAPVITLGTGVGVGDEGKGFIWKSETGLTVKYIAEGGSEIKMELSADGIVTDGNTGEKGVRNVFVSDTAPESPQLNDLWIETDA